MTSIKITFSDDDVVPQQVPKSQNASHIVNNDKKIDTLNKNRDCPQTEQSGVRMYSRTSTARTSSEQ